MSGHTKVRGGGSSDHVADVEERSSQTQRLTPLHGIIAARSTEPPFLIPAGRPYPPGRHPMSLLTRIRVILVFQPAGT